MKGLSRKQIDAKQLNALAHLRRQLAYVQARLDDMEASIWEGRPPRSGAAVALSLEVRQRLTGRDPPGGERA